MELVLIQVKAGSFTMGILPSEPQCDKTEDPRMESPLATFFGWIKRKLLKPDTKRSWALIQAASRRWVQPLLSRRFHGMMR